MKIPVNLTMKRLAGYIADVAVGTLLGGVKKSTKYVSPTFVVKASRGLRLDSRSKSATVVLTMGTPNHRERQFIKACVKAKEPFPVKKIQLRFFK